MNNIFFLYNNIFIIFEIKLIINFIKLKIFLYFIFYIKILIVFICKKYDFIVYIYFLGYNFFNNYWIIFYLDNVKCIFNKFIF